MKKLALLVVLLLPLQAVAESADSMYIGWLSPARDIKGRSIRLSSRGNEEEIILTIGHKLSPDSVRLRAQKGITQFPLIARLEIKKEEALPPHQMTSLVVTVEERGDSILLVWSLQTGTVPKPFDRKGVISQTIIFGGIVVLAPILGLVWWFRKNRKPSYP